MSSTQRKALARGFTLVEMLAALAVTAVALGSVLPDFSRLVQRQRLEGAAAQLETELQLARSQSVADGRNLRIGFHADAAGSCYVIHTGGPGACRCEGAATTCSAEATALRTVAYEAKDALRVTSNAGSLVFDGVKGTITPTASITLANDSGDRLKLVISVMGRVRDCSPSGLRGHRAC